MIEIKSVDGTTLSAQALEHGFVRIRAGGYDGYRESLLERYGFVNRLGPDTDAVETGNDVSLPDGLTITLTDSLGFDVRRKDERLFGSLPHTKVATFPTIAGNSGYQLDLPIVDNEKLIGFGDHQREQFLLNGMRDTLWIEYPVKHVPVPFFMSNRGYGVFFNTTRKLHFDFAVTDSGIARFAVEGDFLDIFIVTGDTYEDMIDSYCKLTGYPGLPPLKSLGLWLIMHTRATGHDVLMFAKTLRDAGIPCDNISLEPDWMQDRYDFSVNKEWSAEKFRGTTPDSWFRAGPNRMINALNRMGFDLGLWLCTRYDFTWEEERRLKLGRRVDGSEDAASPGLAGAGVAGAGVAGASADQDTDGRAGVDAYMPDLEGIVEPDEGEKKGHTPIHMDQITKQDEAWFEHLKRFVDDGVRFFKVDPALLINEFPDRLYGNGRTDDEMHNIAFLLSSKQMNLDYEAHTGKRSYGIAVAGWAGLQRYPGTWAGDTGGGAGPMVGILQDAVVAHSYATCDMNTADVAGLHMGFLLPWSLINSWASFHYPGFQGESMDNAYREYSRLRMSLLYYLYGLSYRAHKTSVAIVRPLFLVWPDRDEAYELTDQYMLGNSLLVSVYRDDVVIPEGRWFDYWTNEIVTGDWGVEKLSVPENRGGHLLMREGGIVPAIDPMQHVAERPVEKITWQIFPGTEATEFTLYVDDGDGLEYRDGSYASVVLRCTPGQTGMKIEWGGIDGDERLADIEHSFEILGTESVSRVAASLPRGVSVLDVSRDALRNRHCFGPIPTGVAVDIEY